MNPRDEPQVVTITDYELARQALRHKELRQALYDAGDVVMADVLVNLHGDAHRARRRLENRLFRKDTHERYERDLFPEVVDDTLAHYVQQGDAELVKVSHQMMMNLAALTAGVDRPLQTPEETFRLYSFLMLFIEGATLAHFIGDRDAKRAQVAEALSDFDREFLQPSIARRKLLLKQVAEGSIDESALPRDVLTVILHNQERLDLPPDVILRETCFYLLSGAHTSATAFVRTTDNVFRFMDANFGDPAIATTIDLGFLQRCAHETIRLQPSSPVAMRWALADVELSSGNAAVDGANGDATPTTIRAGDKVIIDLHTANRQISIFGSDACDFNPDRGLAAGVARWGLSFGLGMHACIGQDLAAGVDPRGVTDPADQLYGLVPVAVQRLLALGGQPDPERPPVLDPTSARGYWSSYPVKFVPS